MSLLRSHIERLAKLSRLLATAPEEETLVGELLQTLRTIVFAKEVRVVHSDAPSAWKDWTAGPQTIHVYDREDFPLRLSKGTVSFFEPENESAGFVWTDSEEPAAGQVLSWVAPMVHTSLMLRAALKRGQQNILSEQSLARKELRARDEERRRIARELHDDLGQSMVTLKLSLKWIEDTIAEKSGMEEAAEELTRARTSVSTMLGKIRDLSHVMYPGVLDTLGIVAAIKELVHQSTSRSGIEIDCMSTGAEQTLPENTAFGMYRCCQEALNNAVRHSEASRIQIEIGFEPGSVRLKVADNGKGFDPRTLSAPGSQATNSGFWTIRQRVADLRGSFRVSTAHRQGTVVEIIVPYDVRKPDGRRKNKTTGRG